MSTEDAYSELETALLEEGFVTPEDMADAQRTRQQCLNRARKPLWLLLSELVKIPPERLTNLMNENRMQQKLGLLGIEKGYVTRQQVTECEAMAETALLSVALVHKGYLTKTQFKGLIDLALNDLALAATAVSSGLVSEQDLELALRIKSHQKSVCEILYDRNMVTLSELNHVIRKFNRPLQIGQILVLQGLLTEEQLEEALAEQSQGALSLGKILLQHNYVAIEQLYFALSIQYNTPFQKLDGYCYYEKQKVVLRDLVGQGYALENQILPLFQNGSNVTLAVSNPANIWAMHGLKSLHPELQMTCVLITDQKFAQLYALLYGEILYAAASSIPVQTGSGIPDQSLRLAQPAAQPAMMEKLYKTYRYCQETAGAQPIQNEQALFYTFIEEQHTRICRQYNCREVLFHFETRGGQTDILASPAG